MSAHLETPFECLFDESPDSGDAGASLPLYLQAVYGGDWALPAATERPYTYSNFVVSHDGRISFNEPGHYGGGDVSGGNRHDTWLMALLRARADAVMVGDNTLTLEPGHLWTHQFISPETTELFHDLRVAEGRARYPLQVFLSMDGSINWDAAVFTTADYHVVIATTHRGAERIRVEQRSVGTLDVLTQDGNAVNLDKLEAALHDRFSVGTLLVEGGPTAYGSAVADRIIDDEFLTLSPIVVGNDRANDRTRPGLFEGLAFSPDNAVRMRPVSLRRNGDYFFVRSRVIYPQSGR